MKFDICWVVRNGSAHGRWEMCGLQERESDRGEGRTERFAIATERHGWETGGEGERAKAEGDVDRARRRAGGERVRGEGKCGVKR